MSFQDNRESRRRRKPENESETPVSTSDPNRPKKKRGPGGEVGNALRSAYQRMVEEDIPLLANHFLTYYWHRHRQMPDRCPRLSEESITFLRSRPWRGNVRELQNVIEHAAVLLEPDQTIQPGDIPLYESGEPMPGVPADGISGSLAASAVNASEPYHIAKDRVVAHFEKEYLAALVARANNNMSKAARLAGVDRTTLYRLMEKHHLVRANSEGASG